MTPRQTGSPSFVKLPKMGIFLVYNGNIARLARSYSSARRLRTRHLSILFKPMSIKKFPKICFITNQSKVSNFAFNTSTPTPNPGKAIIPSAMSCCVTTSLVCPLALMFLAHTSLAINLIDTQVIKAINFAKPKPNSFLKAKSYLKELRVKSEISCQMWCVDTEKCVSYNFGPSPNVSDFVCQLSSLDRFVAWKNFTTRDGFIYRGIEVRT